MTTSRPPLHTLRRRVIRAIRAHDGSAADKAPLTRDIVRMTNKQLMAMAEMWSDLGWTPEDFVDAMAWHWGTRCRFVKRKVPLPCPYGWPGCDHGEHDLVVVNDDE